MRSNQRHGRDVKRGAKYVLDNAAEQTSARFAALPSLYDPGTIRHLEQLGVGAGWRCLEIGGGGGSIAAWLSDRVGPTGQVLATDVDTRFLERLRRPNLEVRRHDIASDPLPDRAFNLVHLRLVLMHLPQRDQVLKRLAGALRPGGWLLAEEFDSLSMPPDPRRQPRGDAARERPCHARSAGFPRRRSAIRAVPAGAPASAGAGRTSTGRAACRSGGDAPRGARCCERTSSSSATPSSPPDASPRRNSSATWHASMTRGSCVHPL